MPQRHLPRSQHLLSPPMGARQRILLLNIRKICLSIIWHPHHRYRMVIAVSGRNILPPLRVDVVLLVANFSVVRRCLRSRRNQCLQASLRRSLRRRQRTRFLCLWVICFTWLTIPVIPDRKKLAVCYSIAFQRKVRLEVVPGVGVAAPLLSLTIVGIPAAEPLERWALLIVKFAVSGASCR